MFGGIFEKYRRLRVAFAHGGGPFPYTVGRIQHGFKVRPDLVAVDNPLSPEHYVGKFWVDSLVHDKRAFKYLLELMGEDRVCLGSDYPFPLGEHKPGRLISKMGLDKKTCRNLLHRNAEDWLGTRKMKGEIF